MHVRHVRIAYHIHARIALHARIAYMHVRIALHARIAYMHVPHARIAYRKHGVVTAFTCSTWISRLTSRRKISLRDRLLVILPKISAFGIDTRTFASVWIRVSVGAEVCLLLRFETQYQIKIILDVCSDQGLLSYLGIYR